MPICCLRGASGKRTSGYLKILNDTICTIRKVSAVSHQMEGWEDSFPDEIKPFSEEKIKVTFVTKKSAQMKKDKGEVAYEVFDNAGLTLATFAITADAKLSESSCCGCCYTFIGRFIVDWQTLPRVFGVTVAPREGKLKFRRKGTAEIKISGKVLEGGDRDPASEMKLTEWMSWQELQPECRVGDVCAVDRAGGAFRHYGVVERIEPDGTVMMSHLIGTAGGLIKEHGVGGGVKEVWKALSGSHGDIAGVATQNMEEFAGGDKCRIENLHDDEWRSYTAKIVLKRMGAAAGFRDYSLFEFNCEHYANLIRYGMPYSAQVEAMKRKFDMAEQGKIAKRQISKGASVAGEQISKGATIAGEQIAKSAAAAGEVMKTEMVTLGSQMSDSAGKAWAGFSTSISQKFKKEPGELTPVDESITFSETTRIEQHSEHKSTIKVEEHSGTNGNTMITIDDDDVGATKL